MLRRVRIAGVLPFVVAAGLNCAPGGDGPGGVDPPAEPRIVVVSIGNPAAGERFAPRIEVRDGNDELVVDPLLVTLRGEPEDRIAGTINTTLSGGVASFDSVEALAAGSVQLTFVVPALSLVARRDLTIRQPDKPPAPTLFAIVGATVVPMDTERSLPNQVVVVRDGVITAVGPAGEVAIPPGATVINAAGKWLMPGLIDFHTHELAPGNWPQDFAGNAVMYLANSVTSIVNMGDFQDGAMVARSQEVRAGAYPGPNIYVGLFARGAADGGTPHTLVTSAADAVALVARVRSGGYDFIKIYDQLTAESYNALAAAAGAQGIAIAGHNPAAVGLASSIQNGQSMVVHATAVWGGLLPGVSNPALVGPAVTALKAAGTYVSPTLYVSSVVRDYGLDALNGADPFARIQTYTGAEYMDDRTRPIWNAMLQFRSDVRSPVDRTAQRAFERALTLALQQGGVPLLMGSDGIGIPGVVPGFSIHGEIAELRAAGLTPFEVLSAGTRTAGQYIREKLRPTERVGVIEVGARADLVLLDGDPLAALGTLERPAGVMVAGRWNTGADLRTSLQALIGSR